MANAFPATSMPHHPTSDHYNSIPDVLDMTTQAQQQPGIHSPTPHRPPPQHHHTHSQAHSHSHSHSLSHPPPQPPTSNQQPPIDQYQFSNYGDQTTLVLGVLGYLERLESEIAEMRDFVNTGFKKLNDVGPMDGGMGARVEGARLQARNWNRTNITELEEPFRILPRSNGEFPSDLPSTGNVLRDVNHKVIDYLLDMYDIPFVPTMFLTEKKMLYLKFIGANRVIMHRILD